MPYKVAPPGHVTQLLQGSIGQISTALVWANCSCRVELFSQEQGCLSTAPVKAAQQQDQANLCAVQIMQWLQHVGVQQGDNPKKETHRTAKAAAGLTI